MELLILILFGFLLMWLLVVLPQRRRQNAQNAMLAELEPGDEIVTAGGLYGFVSELAEDEVLLEVAPDVEVRVARRAIAAVIPPDEEDEEEQVEEEQAEETLERGARAAENQSVGEKPS